MNTVKNIIIIVIIILLLVFGIKQQLDINSLNDNISSLENQLKHMKYENERKENELETPIEDKMEEYAMENGYRDPNAQYFYNDFSG